jgi:hypothetical protein
MLRKSTLIALSAVAALGLAITNASAKPGGPGFGPKGPGFNPGLNKPVFKPNFPKPKIPVKPIFIPKGPHKPHPIWVHHHRPIWYAAPVVVGTTYAVTRPVVSTPGPCTCLSKEYTPEGAVLFKDRCTNEMAMNPPPAPQQTGEVAPQNQYASQYVQPQPQTLAK